MLAAEMPSISFKKLLIYSFANLVEYIRGPSNLVEINTNINEIESLMGYSIQGYTIKIHCQEKKYLCQYRYKYIADRIRTVYHVSTTLSSDAPDKLVKLCSEEKQFPKLLSGWMPSASQKEAAIKAYLDLIIFKLRESNLDLY